MLVKPADRDVDKVPATFALKIGLVSGGRFPSVKRGSTGSTLPPFINPPPQNKTKGSHLASLGLSGHPWKPTRIMACVNKSADSPTLTSHVSESYNDLRIILFVSAILQLFTFRVWLPET